MKEKTFAIGTTSTFFILFVLGIWIYSLKHDLNESNRYIGCLEDRWKEYRNEINCLEWKYEREKVLDDADFDNRFQNRRIMTRDGYEYTRPYENSRFVQEARKARQAKEKLQ